MRQRIRVEAVATRFESHRFTAAVLFVLALVAALPLRATTIVMPTDEQLVEKTSLIVVGRVSSTGVVDRSGIRTESTIEVEEVLKGEAPATLTVSELGGVIGDRVNVVYGAPVYKVGERVLLFASPYVDGLYRTRDLFVGKFSERRAVDGTRIWHRDNPENTTVLGGNLRALTAAPVERSADAFETFIRQRTAGAAVTRNYELEGVTLQSSTGSGAISGNFTMISEPQIYRWTAFDRGATADWYSIGSQTGYSSGGLNEINAGMTAWTNYSAAKILYRYAGTSTKSAAGLRAPNGVNEIVFNDATNEIDGSYNPRTGGVVGVGGFNNTSNGGTWSAPFTADTTHTAKSYSTAAITEANLVIQDGVTAANGISSSVLAEIIAHELGHTLGFGHSADGTALMYYSVTGGGPSLKSDDQTAARWLYPNGSGVPTPAAVTAAFTFSPQSPTTADNVTFMDASTGSPTSWSWNFGDGTSSASKSPTHRYANAGSYTASLTVSNGSTSSTVSRLISVGAVAPATPPVTADFTMSQSSVITGQSVTFTDASSGSPSSWSWNFGDGSTAFGRTVTHSYVSGGTYSVTLTVANSVSSNSRTKTLVVTPAMQTFESVIAATAQTSGVGSTYWRTELTIFNGGSAAANLELIFVPGAGGSVLTQRATLGANGTLRYGNALRDLFNLTSGAGALIVRGTSSVEMPQLKVASRTYTDGGGGSYGQFVPDLGSSDAPGTAYVTALENSSSFRTNVGLVNRTGGAITATLTLFDAAGATLGETTIPVAPNTFQQTALSALFPQISGADRDSMTMRVVTNMAGALYAYASIVDNRSQDPIYVAAAAQAASSGVVIPAVGRTDGANGTYWRSDVTLHNPAASSMTVYARLWNSGADNRGAAALAIVIPARRTVAMRDIVAQITGGAAASGALELTWNGGGPVVTSRTYTTRADGGTFGQNIEASTPSAFGSRSVVTGLRSDGAFRSNVGVVNRGDDAMTFTMLLYNAFGNVVATSTRTLPAKSQLQGGIPNFFANVDPSALGNFTMEVRSSNNSMLAYGSVVDNLSGDPIFIAGE